MPCLSPFRWDMMLPESCFSSLPIQNFLLPLMHNRLLAKEGEFFFPSISYVASHGIYGAVAFNLSVNVVSHAYIGSLYIHPNACRDWILFQFKTKGGSQLKEYCTALTKEDCRRQSGSFIACEKVGEEYYVVSIYSFCLLSN